MAPAPRLVVPRLRSIPVAIIAAIAAIAGWLAHPGLGVALTVFAIGIAFRFPDPEDEHAARLAERRAQAEAARRRARAATELAPEGEIEVDGGRRRARMLVGTARPGDELDVVNEIDGQLIVRRAR